MLGKYVGVKAMWEWDTRVRWLLAFVIAALIFGGGYKYGSWQERTSENSLPKVVMGEEVGVAETNEEIEATEEKPNTIMVHVTGAVKMPGVYKLSTDARVNDAISMAGLLPDANPNALNLAQHLNDGQKIVVPRQGEITIPGNFTNQETTINGFISNYDNRSVFREDTKVNINTATISELEELPGIGSTLAKRIVDYRTQKGYFRSIEDLKNVSGIGTKKFADLKELISTN
ncbi:MAG: competence protein ComEA [Clostridia bacterium]|nr:competence protein ComEA [Clostridia bacterium]